MSGAYGGFCVWRTHFCRRLVCLGVRGVSWVARRMNFCDAPLGAGEFLTGCRSGDVLMVPWHVLLRSAYGVEGWMVWPLLRKRWDAMEK